MQALQSLVSSSQIYLEIRDLTSSIPIEILENILKSLPLKDQLNVECVCRKWNRVVKGNGNDLISALQYKINPCSFHHVFIDEISVPFYQVNFNSAGEIFHYQIIDKERKMYDHLIKRRVVSEISEIEVSRTLAKKILRIAMGELKMKILKKELVKISRDFLQEKTKEHGSSLLNFINIINENVCGREEKIEAFLYEAYPLHGMGEPARQIFIPSLKMGISKELCMILHYPPFSPFSKYLKIKSALIRLPIEFIKQIERIDELRKEIESLKGEIFPELNFLDKETIVRTNTDFWRSIAVSQGNKT